MEDSSNPISHLSKPEAMSEAMTEDTAVNPPKATISDLGDSTALAAVLTAAESVDIDSALAAAKDVEAGQTASLAEALSGCGKTLSRAATQENTSRKTLHRGLVDVLASAELAYEHPELLVALAAEKGVKTTKASWRTPFLVPLKLAQPGLDNKLASFYAKGLNNIAARGLSGDDAFRFLSEHGVAALAAEEAKRQKARKGGNTEKPPAMDPLEALRRERTPVPLSTERDLDGLPEKEGDVGLMLISRQDGLVVGWAIDAEEKAIAASIRRILKRKAGGRSD